MGIPVGEQPNYKEQTLRQMAAKIAASLPEDMNDAHRVLSLSGEFFDEFLFVPRISVSREANETSPPVTR